MSDTITFKLHDKFARALTVMANETWIMAGRGSAKTTQVTGPWMKHKVDVMPRSTGGLLGQSFTDLETKILQPIFISWEMMGLEMDNHYVYGRRPYNDWDKPYTPVLDWSHVISFPNGSTIDLISLHLKGSANSKSLQWIAAPEAKLLNATQIREEVVPILRGHRRHFGTSPWYGAKLYETDKLSPNLNWILEKRLLHNEDIIRAIIYYQVELNEAIIKKASVSRSQGYIYNRKIEQLEHILAGLRKNTVYVGEANAYDNIENLGLEYVENMRRTLTPYEFRIAILNEDPTIAENGFYPNRTEAHLHMLSDDDDVTMPLGVAFDYQASVTPLVSFQINEKVLPGQKTLNFLHSIYVKYPYGPKEVINNFCTLHRLRPCKHVFYFYDHTAVGERAGHKKPYEEIIEYFEANGWTVTPIYMGMAPRQSHKYNRVNHYLSNTDGTSEQIRMHKQNCASMILSMDLTGTKEAGKGTEKDKGKERDKSFPQEQATHFSDTFDMALWGCLELKLWPSNTYSQGEFAMR